MIAWCFLERRLRRGSWRNVLIMRTIHNCNIDKIDQLICKIYCTFSEAYQNTYFYTKQPRIALVYSFATSKIERCCTFEKWKFKIQTYSHAHFLVAQYWFLSRCHYALLRMRVCLVWVGFIMISLNLDAFIFESLHEVKHVFLSRSFYQKTERL